MNTMSIPRERFGGLAVPARCRQFAFSSPSSSQVDFHGVEIWTVGHSRPRNCSGYTGMFTCVVEGLDFARRRGRSGLSVYC